MGGSIDRITHRGFGRWAAAEVSRSDWDVVIGWSSVSEETFRQLGESQTLKVLERGSAHVRVQWKLLNEECRRAERWVETPSAWIIAREEREYELADVIQVPSSFAVRSFLSQGLSANKILRLFLGVDTKAFRAPEEVIAARCQRILSGEPLRILNVGTFSHRKGARDFVAAIQALGTQRFQFRFVGPIAKDAKSLTKTLGGQAHFVPKQPQMRLPKLYQWGDLFALLTIEDGRPTVLTQALAAGLPVLATANCEAPDIVREAETGWIIPSSSPKAVVECLRWCDAHRQELVRVVRQVHASNHGLDWATSGDGLEQNLARALARKRNGRGCQGAPSPE
jgi:glycosyltransferase involved in cell wall biosynthesis